MHCTYCSYCHGFYISSLQPLSRTLQVRCCENVSHKQMFHQNKLLITHSLYSVESMQHLHGDDLVLSHSQQSYRQAWGKVRPLTVRIFFGSSFFTFNVINDNISFDLLDKNLNHVALRLFLLLLVKIHSLLRTMIINTDFAIYLNYVASSVRLIKERCAPHRYHLIIIILSDAIWCWN